MIPKGLAFASQGSDCLKLFGPIATCASLMAGLARIRLDRGSVFHTKLESIFREVRRAISMRLVACFVSLSLFEAQHLYLDVPSLT
jgi:hypothetical protein